ncbi:MAG: DUF4230 domain-containing protein [Anaerolineae bacterium]
MLKKTFYIIMIIFLIIGSIAAYAIATVVNKTDKGVVEPIGNLVRQLVLPATPVILPSPSTILLNMEQQFDVITISSEFEKIVTAERNQEVLWGALGETMVFVANGTVAAGIDMSQMKPEDIQVLDPVTVQIHLPPAQIFEEYSSLNNDKSYVADRDTGIFTRADPELETQVRRVAEQQLIEAAQNSNLLQLANENAEQEIRALLEGLGFVNIEFWDETPPPAPTYNAEVPKGYALTPEPQE